MGPGTRCPGSEPQAPGRHRFLDEMHGVCAGACGRGMLLVRGQLPLTEGQGRTLLITWACVCVSGWGSGCWWLPRTDSPPQTARFSPEAAPALLKGPRPPLSQAGSLPWKALEIAPDSPGGQTLLQESLPRTSYSPGLQRSSPSPSSPSMREGTRGIFRKIFPPDGSKH